MDEKILIVDDEPNVLEGLQRVLRKEFNVVTAIGGEAGLTAVAEQGPFAVIVSDMRMPGMDGTQFLRTVLERTPDSVRLALTGNADIQTAIRRGERRRNFSVFVEAVHRAGIERRAARGDRAVPADSC
jgi:DNA-binding NtrC family response regulator